MGGNAEGAEREAQGSPVRSEKHSPQCGMICVPPRVDEGQSARLPRSSWAGFSEGLKHAPSPLPAVVELGPTIGSAC